MYRTCIFCSGELGANEAIEAFPVGKSLAFDAARGRLWAVCPRCTRWNLAPIEERWEAVEDAEKRFRDARLRAQSENVGLAKLPDGTRLIRIGEALPGELAAWRYGGQLVSRRKRYALVVGAGVVATGAVLVGIPLLVGGVSASVLSVLHTTWNLAHRRRHSRSVVYRIAADDSPTGEPLELRRFNFNAARVTSAADGEIALHLPVGVTPAPGSGDSRWLPLTLEGRAARAVLGRTLVTANQAGASGRDVERALGLITGLGGTEDYLRHVGSRGVGMRLEVVTRPGSRSRLTGRGFSPALPASSLTAPESLALEMALHEETERRALEGELAVLEAAWREAEEIAAIADVLPDDPMDRLKGA